MPRSMHTDTHNIDGGEVGTEREIHTLPHTRRATGPADYGAAARAAEGLSDASRSIRPGEKPWVSASHVKTAAAGMVRWNEYGEISRG